MNVGDADLYGVLVWIFAVFLLVVFLRREKHGASTPSIWEVICAFFDD